MNNNKPPLAFGLSWLCYCGRLNTWVVGGLLPQVELAPLDFGARSEGSLSN
jgi:hypothetical protein